MEVNDKSCLRGPAIASPPLLSRTWSVYNPPMPIEPGPQSDRTELPKGPEDARYLENIIEHGFLSELLEHYWFAHRRRVEVIRPDVDGGGYDLVLEANRRVRHVQLKGRYRKASGPKVVKVHSRLRDHWDPCVIWIFWDWDETLNRVRLEYRYSSPKQRSWPDPDPPDSPVFKLRNEQHFLKDLDIALLARQLFEPDLVPDKL